MQKLDFIILSVGRVATQAIWRYTSCHPELYVPSFYLTDELIRNNREDQLKGLYQNVPSDKLRGIIIHDEKILNILPKFEYTKVIHMVRNPYDMAKALYNHTLHRSYIFDSVKHPGTLEQYLEANSSSFCFYKIGFPIYKEPDQVKTIDFTEMKDENISQTMRDLFSFLDVDESYDSALFHITQQDDTSALMRGIFPPNIIHSNGRLSLKMAYAGDEIFSGEGSGHRFVGSLEKPSAFFSDFTIPFQDKKLDIFVQESELNKMNPDERQLLQDNLTQNLTTALKTWAKSIEKLEVVIFPQRVKELSKSQRQWLDGFIKHDMKKMIQTFPKLKNKWF